MARSSAADEAAERQRAYVAGEIDEDGQPIEQSPQLPGESDYVPASLEIERLAKEYAIGEEEVTFQIHRQGAGGIKDLTFIKSVAPDQFSYEMLQSPPYGGGSFRIYIRNGSGFKRNFLAVVEPVAVAAVAQAQPGNDGAIAAMIAAMSAGFASLGQLIVKQGAQVSGGMDVTQTIGLITALQGLTNHAPVAPVHRERDPLEMMEKLMTIQKLMAPAGGGSDATGENVMIEAIRAFGPVLVNGIGKQPQAVIEAPQAQVLALAAPVVANPIAGQPAPLAQPVTEMQPNDEDSEMNLKMACLKPAILMMAATGADPYPYANMVLDTFSDDEIEKYINLPDWWPELLKLIPEAANYQPWFAALRESVLEILRESAEADTVAKTS